MTRLLPVLALFACTTEGQITPIDLPDDPGVQPATPLVNESRTAPAPITAAFEPRNTWSSSPIAQDAVGQQVITVDRDNQRLVVLDTATNAVRTAELGEMPSHVARVGNEVLVTLRGERSLVRLALDTLEVLDTVELGAEPMGIATRPDGQRIYVALSQDNQVVELDSDLQVLARIEVPSEPRYLALHPDGQRLFVGSGRGLAVLSQIDLTDLSTIQLPLPSTQRESFQNGLVDLVPRITGDLAIAMVQGRAKLAVPVLYSDTITPVPDIADPDEIVPTDPNQDPFFPGEEGGYGAGGGTDVDRLNPAIVTYDVEEVAVPGAAPILAVAPVQNGFMTGDFEFVTVRSYINHVAWGPQGRLLATMEAEGATLVFDPNTEVFTESFFFPPEAGGFRTVAVAAARIGAGAMGALYTGPDDAFAVSAFDLQVAPLPVTDLHQRVQELQMMGFLEAMPPFEATGAVSFGTSPLSAQVQLGRRLFFSADNPSMGAGGVSCSTCHFEGRNDGITWTFEGGPRQTPSLAGVVSATAPVTWTSNVASVAMEADITTRGRMGGQGLNAAELAAVEAFVDSTPLPDIPTVGDPAAVARGAVVFEQSGCASCHSGEAFTDNADHTVRGMSLNTPKLLGVAGSAPYLVDGSASSLRQVLEMAAVPGNMGSTAGLSQGELDDLEAYLLTL